MSKIFYSLFSGIIYEVEDREVKNLDDGQIPLKSKPTPSCNHCYGRGYDYIDNSKGIYNICKCMKKHIADDYKPQQIQLLPTLNALK